MKKYMNSQRGSAMYITIIVIALVTTIVIALSNLIIIEFKLSNRYKDAMMTSYAMETGQEIGLYKTKIVNNIPSIYSPTHTYANIIPGTKLTYHTTVSAHDSKTILTSKGTHTTRKIEREVTIFAP